MAVTYCILGETGTGKSTSLGKIPELGIEGLDPKETAIINIVGKPLPFPGSKKLYNVPISEGGNYASALDGSVILKILKYINEERPDIKNIVLDDAQYVMSDEYMKKALKTGYTKFSEIAKHMYDVIIYGKDMRDDINFILLSHSELNEKTNSYKMKTIGKLLDEKVTLEGLFTVVLYSQAEYDTKEKKGVFSFITNKYQNLMGTEYPAKSPIGMFKDLLIPNDLGLVIKKAQEYYN